jgi:pimeloyl-ACP methyl ester carboxylesterase
MSLAVRVVQASINAVSAVAPGVAGRLAFEVWRRPLVRGRVRTDECAIHDAARVEVVDGIATYVWGDGRRPVLLVHGWRSRASRYAAFVARLLELGYSPISYDAPGHGDTAGPAGTILDHQRIIRRLAKQHGTFEGVIAHSLGVPFALYAVREGVAAGRIVTISGVCEFEYLVDAFCKELRLRRKVNQALRRAIERGLFQDDRGIWTKFSATQPAEADLLVVHNDLDEVVDPAQATRLVTAYGERASLLQTTGLGHHRILSDPAVIEQATAFLTRKVPPPKSLRPRNLAL